MPTVVLEDPRDLLLDLITNDLVITDDLDFARGIDAVVQDCRIAVQTFLEEWFMDLDQGIPYMQLIFSQKPASAGVAIAQITIRSALLSVDGVAEITKFEVNFTGKTRALSIVFAIRATNGVTSPDIIVGRIEGAL